jgi:hypothetical protein
MILDALVTAGSLPLVAGNCELGSVSQMPVTSYQPQATSPSTGNQATPQLGTRNSQREGYLSSSVRIARPMFANRYGFFT